MENIITASIVLYNNNIELVRSTIRSFSLSKLTIKLFLIDNSISNKLEILANEKWITYIHNPSNPGFGTSHNIAIKKSIELGSFAHFIVNPDIYFEEDVLSPMVDYMDHNEDVGMVMPKVLNYDGSDQFLPKLLPSPFSIIIRKINFANRFFNEFINKYELRAASNNIVYNVPIISGCFSLVRINAIKEVGFYDDKFFMYFEDWDLSRRINQKFNTVYFPLVSVYHGYDSGANKNFKLFKIFIRSAVYYFNKWGWFFDKNRKQINLQTLSQLN